MEMGGDFSLGRDHLHGQLHAREPPKRGAQDLVAPSHFAYRRRQSLRIDHAIDANRHLHSVRPCRAILDQLAQPPLLWREAESFSC